MVAGMTFFREEVVGPRVGAALVDSALNISIHNNASNDNPVVSPLITPLTSSPVTCPLTESTGESPLEASTPQSDELNVLLSPSVPVEGQDRLTKRRLQQSGFFSDAQHERRRRWKKRCYVLGSCIGIVGIATALVIMQHYMHIFTP